MEQRDEDSGQEDNKDETPGMQELIKADEELNLAYRNLDRGRRRLKTVKSLVFQGDDEKDVREEMGEENYFKLREMEN